MPTMRSERTTIIACIIACTLAFVVSMAALQMIRSTGKDPTPPAIVTQFLEAYLDRSRDRSTDSQLMEAYFDLEASPEEWGDYEDYTFARMVYERVEDFTTFEIDPVAPGFLKLTLIQMDGTKVTPPIGFWYETNAEQNRITGWAIAHLQPFSKYDEEYGEGY